MMAPSSPHKNPEGISAPGERRLPFCPVCGSGERAFLYRWEEGYAVHRCVGCRLLYTDPLPTDAFLQANFITP